MFTVEAAIFGGAIRENPRKTPSPNMTRQLETTEETTEVG